MGGWVGGWMDGWTDGQTDGQTDGWMSGSNDDLFEGHRMTSCQDIQHLACSQIMTKKSCAFH